MLILPFTELKCGVNRCGYTTPSVHTRNGFHHGRRAHFRTRINPSSCATKPLFTYYWVRCCHVALDKHSYLHSVMSLLLPAAFFAALDRGAAADLTPGATGSVVNDIVRHNILQISRGLAVILLLV